jgi:Holliday junction DNA helicase RuvA
VIGQLTGTIGLEDAEGGIVIHVHGVGYEIAAPLGTIGRARARSPSDETVTLFVHTHVREDALSLFGFATPEDKAAFRTLISVSNVGPKIALAVLSSMPADQLAAAVAARDLAKLVAVPGIGKKTAERLLLELKDKLSPKASSAAPHPPREAGSSGRPSTQELLASALTRMGYRPSEADRAISQIGAKIETEPLGSLIREALVLLAR